MANMSLIKNEMPSQDPAVRSRNFDEVALGYTKEMVASLKTMPFGVKSLEKRQADLIARLFPDSEQRGINVTRLVVRAIELHIIDVENLEADE